MLETLRQRAVDQIKLEKELRDAIARREFELYFQPIVSLNDRCAVGFEALIRWFSPTRSLVSPLEFIDVAERTGLIVPRTCCGAAGTGV